MDIRNLTTFMHVAELGSFSRAAERLGYSQPTVSVQIRQLERELGFRLFDRIGHAVRLTERGQDTLSYAQQICRLCSRMASDVSEETGKRTLVRLAMADSLAVGLLDERFCHFRSMYPQISICLTTAGTDELFRLLDHNEVDIVCTLDTHIYDTNYVIAGEEKVGVHFVVSADSPLAKKEQLSREDLAAQDVLLTEKGMSYRRILDEWLAKDYLEIRPVLETGRTDLLCQLAEQGVGVAFLPDYVTKDAVTRGTLRRLEVEGFRPELWKQLLYHRGKWISPAMQAVLDVLSSDMPSHRA